MSENVIKTKSFRFAVQVVKTYQRLSSEKKEYVLSKQLLRSGTSFGANVREAVNAQSPADFIHKFAISQKECGENLYWLELLHETNYIAESDFKPMHADATELLKILRSIILTSKQKGKSNS
jgi:four helix bundle protein